MIKKSINEHITFMPTYVINKELIRLRPSLFEDEEIVEGESVEVVSEQVKRAPKNWMDRAGWNYTRKDNIEAARKEAKKYKADPNVFKNTVQIRKKNSKFYVVYQDRDSTGRQLKDKK